jgi:hypothetical protein
VVRLVVVAVVVSMFRCRVGLRPHSAQVSIKRCISRQYNLVLVSNRDSTEKEVDTAFRRVTRKARRRRSSSFADGVSRVNRK